MTKKIVAKHCSAGREKSRIVVARGRGRENGESLFNG